MEALILLIPLSLLAVGIAVAVFFRMNATGQFDDDEGPAWSVLMDDDSAQAPPSRRSADAAAVPPEDAAD